MNDQASITRMAREAGFSVYRDISAVDGSIANLKRLVELARANEREACAKFFEEHWRETWTDEQIVEAIRARGQA